LLQPAFLVIVAACDHDHEHDEGAI
jgi:hypothetical protein